jgi:hypothetical protein
MTSATTSSARPTVPASSVARPSSRQTAPLPARARSSLASRMAKPGLASRLEMPPETDRYNDLSYDFTTDVPNKDTEMPAGWETDPNWDSDASVWDKMNGPVKSHSLSPVPELRLQNSLGFPSFPSLPIYIPHHFPIPSSHAFPISPDVASLRSCYLIVPSRDSDSSYHI